MAYRHNIIINKDDRSIRGKPWLVRWYGEFNLQTGTKKRCSRSFFRKSEAEQYANQLQDDLDQGMPKEPQNISLQKLCDDFVSTKDKIIAYSSLQDYIDTINRLITYFHPSILISQITPAEASRFINQMQILHRDHKKTRTKISSATRNKIIKAVKTIFNFGVDNGYIRANPFSKLKTTKSLKADWYYISPAEFKALLAVTPNLRIKTLYAVLYGCGLRLGEALNLLWDSNIDFKSRKIILLNRNGTDKLPPFQIKDKESRTLPLPDWVYNLLIELRDDKNLTSSFVFLTPGRCKLVYSKWQEYRQKGNSEKWSNDKLENNLLRHFKNHCKKAGIITALKLNIHCLRKAFGTTLANNNVPFPTLKKLMGHSSIETTMQYYLKSSVEQEEKACRAMEEAMG